MKILYDHQIFGIQKFGGVSRYYYELISNIGTRLDCNLPLVFSNNDNLKKRDISNHLRLFPNYKSPRINDFIRKTNKINAILSQHSRYDLFHPTYYDPYFLKHIGKTPFVLTVYDMIHEKYNIQQNNILEYKKILCNKATKIIAISANTKNDLVNMLGINEAKIEVIYLGQSLQMSSKNNLVLPDKYILFTGNRDGYKNFKRFAKAFSMLHNIDSSIALICTGSAFKDDEIQFLHKIGISEVVKHQYVTDENLSELYRRALLFVFPSEYEGFGIPILESFAAGCPVALSNASCFPEIARNAAIYFDPLEEESIFDAMFKVYNSNKLRAELQKRGYKRLSNFSWNKMADETVSLYKSLL